MTDNTNKLTVDELWAEAEMWLNGIEDTLAHRCYQERSMTGVRAIQLDVRKHLTWVDRVLLEIEVRGNASKT